MKYENSGWSIVSIQQIAVIVHIIIMTFVSDIVLVSQLNADEVSLRIISLVFFSGLALSSTLNQEPITVSWVWSFLPEIGKRQRMESFYVWSSGWHWKYSPVRKGCALEGAHRRVNKGFPHMGYD